MSRYIHFRPLCWHCFGRGFHFFHNDGTLNRDRATRADPNCDACMQGDYHFTHDTKAFNSDKLLGGG